MAIPRTVPAALGAVAFFPTTAILGIHIILARSPADRASSVRTTGIVAALFEAVIFVAVPFLSLSHVVPWAPSSHWKWFRRVWFDAGLALCTVATVISISNIVCLSKVVHDPLSTILGWGVGDFLVGASVALGLAFATQLVFFIFHFLAGRALGSRPEGSAQTELGNKLGPRIKTVPYHETTPTSAKDRGSASFDSPTPPGSSGDRSGMETINSARSSLSHAIRPITSKTRLLSLSRRSSHRPTSLDLPAAQDRQSRSTEVGFDSWDTSAVDPETRQTVLESSSPPHSRFLETIPASPTTSRSPSPGTALDILEPPRAKRRSRSYSPVSTRAIQAQRVAFTQQESNSEAHIHPLFRSDSPAPPSATPGTVVVAAPNAGQVISDKHSIRSIQSIRRLRSESLPPVPGPSPLSRAGSCESFARRRADSSSPELREEDEVEAVVVGAAAAAAAVDTERKMTPPIPDYILNAGSTSSLTTSQKP
ncbi:hypothetical protein CHGG_03218 [Chaetomium globosum CBS 148.51]|uniref:Uncharacterized protein n=1 Tax=Chaetomium globosum (strain ATCC 6205 / CBS 148.51 / DSM 1962 / NBRC 6347 / NRRL 1970) TaxID=306901 RepID=Q2H986_CHAGB|nr:uncharacterized protein CHGG_03218 [Chaetomium globosum CBS 148.51]EAQ91283.1 hypothetical protein CHGG_03218 [Chaetomium globosum CBS 148.51]